MWGVLFNWIENPQTGQNIGPACENQWTEENWLEIEVAQAAGIIQKYKKPHSFQRILSLKP